MAGAGNPKPYLAIVDGVVGGEGNGPLCPDPVRSNVLISGTDPAAIDAVVARLMGFYPKDLPIVNHSFGPHRWPITTRLMENMHVFDERVGREVVLDEVAPAVEGGFTPHFGWSDIRLNRKT